MPVSGSLIEVVVGLALVYILTALICAAAREGFAFAFRLREKLLIGTIRALLGGDDGAAQLCDRILGHPAIRNPRLPGGSGPSYLPARLFAAALLDDLTVRARASGTAHPRVVDLVTAAPNGDLQRSLHLFAQEAGLDRELFRQRIEAWYDDAMGRASACYRRRSRTWILAFAVAGVAVANIDTLEIARALWGGGATVGSGFPIGWTASDPGGVLATILDHPSKLLGFLITAVAVSYAAEFGYSLLQRRGSPGTAAERSAHGPGASPVSGPPLTGPRIVSERPESDLEASGLTRDDIEDIQRALGMTGRFLTGQLDPATRSMIEEYQLSVGRRPTGVLTPFLVERLLAPAER